MRKLRLGLPREYFWTRLDSEVRRPDGGGGRLDDGTRRHRG